MIKTDNYVVKRTAELSDKELDRLLNLVDEQNTWADFILQDHANQKYWERMHKDFPNYQFFLLDGETLVGCGNCLPLHLENKDLTQLPDEGWDWAMTQAFEGKKNGTTPNALSAIQISINPAYRGKGVSQMLVGTMKHIAQEQGFGDFILPVRPNLKHKYPLIDIDQYIEWKTEEGLPYDAWLRVHARNGAQMIKSCKKSMFVSGTIAQWEAWTGYDLKSSGQYLFPSALTPIEVDLEKDLATYCEPNVWMHYTL